ncbi:aspartate-semialdehyde dehydrogenase [Gregarina niphandrodes]|uniref:Aspartate-semialdehyde dehydrogenase n=1 Tax=Gregarina niphandrodes TaxID=110365 RepID=A0A023B0M8_GRENI|nr:aspartate-semialdehyde dehydrogenase [Gregarina niphandrodes]EZG45466.1 aspartate-semialdehyde dehydrogenase [Gregarina niphandrodes]|eukprot:XP_011132484.1 aspartate-semialdehyde dehydrogenase [Gregarina niphandrodes]
MTLTLSNIDYNISPKFRAGVLGGTGTVGQNLVLLLANHPWITVVAIGASERNAGKRYQDVWRNCRPCPEVVKDIVLWDALQDKKKFITGDLDLVFSALDSELAVQVESDLAASGLAVFSNASSHRGDIDVPIVLPLVNPGHLELVKIQRFYAKSGGYIVTNSNCSTAGFVTALKALQDAFGVDSAICTTMQAVSGAGNPGPHWNQIDSNVVPYIPGEEEKIENETKKILGKLPVSAEQAPALDAHTCAAEKNTGKETDGSTSVEHQDERPPLSDASSSTSGRGTVCAVYGKIHGIIPNDQIRISASVNRVPVVDGHTMSVSVKLTKPPLDENMKLNTSAIEEAFENFTFSIPDMDKLPVIPSKFIQVFRSLDEPQPKFHSQIGNGMTVSIGKVRACSVLDVKFTLVVNNAILGAAGGAVANAELAIASRILL